MAKALFGHVGALRDDPVTTAEVARLRVRVRQLEADVARLRAENDQLSRAARRDEDVMDQLRVVVGEPTGVLA